MAEQPTLFVLANEELAPYAASFGKPPSAAAELLARALVSSPAWASMPTGTVLIARQEPQPAVALLGHLDEAAKKRLPALRTQLRSALERFRYVSYEEAERACDTLARRLVERFGRDAIQRFRFVGLPRGGLLVLGMLSYALDLDHAQLIRAPQQRPADTPLVVVDDCALTGSRFERFLTSWAGSRVIFAPLYAPPELRAAVERAEPRVTACLSARDLRDHGPERLGAAYDAWKERWAERAHGARYWIGQPDHVCFPWNEPDMGVWNASSEAVEPGWRVVPPARCLKNRAPGSEARSSSQAPICVQPIGQGPLVPAAAVFFGPFESALVVAHAGRNTSFRLSGSSAEMWRTLVRHGSVDATLRALRATYDVEAGPLAADLKAFIETLLAHDLLRDQRQAAVAPGT